MDNNERKEIDGRASYSDQGKKSKTEKRQKTGMGCAVQWREG